MAPTYLASIIGILSVVLPLIGIHVAAEVITNTVTLLCLIIVAVRQLVTGRSTFGGFRPKNG